MRLLRVLVTLPLWFLLVAQATPSPSTTTATTPTPPAATPSPPPPPTPIPSPTPVPTPTPVNAFITLDVTSGGPNTAITVNGGQFLPNQPMTLYWDQTNKVAGSATADANGSFSTRVKPFDGDAPGVHKLCASVQPNPCANFTLEAAAAPSPTPSPSPSPSPQATPSASASPVPLTTPMATTLNGFDVITKPPFVFLPLIGLAALVVSLGYWVLSIVRRPRTINFPSAAVVHRATRPDYTAEFGTPPPTPASAPATSAWADVVPKAPVPPTPRQAPESELPLPTEGAGTELAPAAAEEPPPYEWPELPAPTAEEMREEMRQFLSPPDDPLDLPEPGK